MLGRLESQLHAGRIAYCKSNGHADRRRRRCEDGHVYHDGHTSRRCRVSCLAYVYLLMGSYLACPREPSLE